MKVLGLRNSLGKAFSDTITAVAPWAEGQYNCTVLLFNEALPNEINNIRPLTPGYSSEFNYALLKDCVGMFNAIFSYNSTKNKFVLSNPSLSSEAQAGSVRKVDQFAPSGISCLLIPTLNATSMVTPINTTISSDTLWYGSSLVMQRSGTSVIEIPRNLRLSNLDIDLTLPRFGSGRSTKSVIQLTYMTSPGTPAFNRGCVIEYKERKIINKLLMRVHLAQITSAFQMRIHYKDEQGMFQLLTSFRLSSASSFAGNYVEINVPEFESDCINIEGMFVSGGVTQGNPGIMYLSEVVLGRSNQSTAPAFNANFGLVAFGTLDYSERMNDVDGRFPQSQIPMFLLPTGTDINQIDVNLNDVSSYLRLNKNVEI